MAEMKDAQTCMRAVFRGRVQGVGFRYSAVSLAQQYAGVTGYVKNLPDRSVEVVAEGSEQDLVALVQGLLSSQVGRYIVDHTVVWEPARGRFKTFGIAY